MLNGYARVSTQDQNPPVRGEPVEPQSNFNGRTNRSTHLVERHLTRIHSHLWLERRTSACVCTMPFRHNCIRRNALIADRRKSSTLHDIAFAARRNGFRNAIRQRAACHDLCNEEPARMRELA